MTKEFFKSQLTRDKKPFSDLNWMEEMQQCTKNFARWKSSFEKYLQNVYILKPCNKQANVLKNVYKEVRLLRTMKYKLLYEFIKRILHMAFQ